MWIFATVQFGLVVLFGHVFYSVVRFETDFVKSSGS